MSYPLALIHGWGQHGGIWRQFLSGLSVPVACNLELPGHGDAPTAAFDIDALVDAYAAQAPAACNVVAWSLGGMLALRWAQRHPQQVKKLVLFSTTPCFGMRTDWPHGSPDEVQQAFAAQVEASPGRALQRFADLLAAGEADMKGVRLRLREHLAEKALPATDSLLAGLSFLKETDLRVDLLSAPPAQAILLIHGEGDTITPFGAGRWLAEHLPHARLHALPHCGHAPMVSHADVLTAPVRAFLDQPA
jgi:pimeloyl-[acyl-carrier protein] methyl ester esterase